jgi:hypothetical protein
LKILNGNHQFWQQEEEELGEAILLLIIHPHKSIFQLLFLSIARETQQPNP